MKSTTFVRVVSAFAAFAACQFLFGQATGSISGTITDPSGASVAGAKVTIEAQATGAKREAVSDNSGRFVVPLLGVAHYKVRVEAPGFAPVEVEDVNLQTNEQRELDLKLSPATVQQSVDVSAAPVAVETANPTLGKVITSQQVAELPLNGRDFVQLATLTPGTVQETNPGSFFNGARAAKFQRVALIRFRWVARARTPQTGC